MASTVPTERTNPWFFAPTEVFTSVITAFVLVLIFLLCFLSFIGHPTHYSLRGDWLHQNEIIFYRSDEESYREYLHPRKDRKGPRKR